MDALLEFWDRNRFDGSYEIHNTLPGLLTRTIPAVLARHKADSGAENG